MNKQNELRSELSNEWNKPKAKNIRPKHDRRQIRDYTVIKKIQKEINRLRRAQIKLMKKFNSVKNENQTTKK